MLVWLIWVIIIIVLVIVFFVLLIPFNKYENFSNIQQKPEVELFTNSNDEKPQIELFTNMNNTIKDQWPSIDGYTKKDLEILATSNPFK